MFDSTTNFLNNLSAILREVTAVLKLCTSTPTSSTGPNKKLTKPKETANLPNRLKVIESKAERGLAFEIKLNRIRDFEERLNVFEVHEERITVLEVHINQLTVLLETLLREKAGRYIEAQTDTFFEVQIDTLFEAQTGRLLEAQTDRLVALQEQRKGQKTIESSAPSGN